MRLFRPLAAAVAALATIAACAAEIEVLSAVGFKMVMAEAATRFEGATGHRVRVRYGTLGDVVKRVQGGESADAIVIPRQGLEQLAKDGKVEGAIEPIATSQLAMGVRSGATRPDISTPENFRKAMLDAKSVMLVNPAQGGASYVAFSRMPGHDGIAREAAEGKVDIVLNQMQELMDIPGVDIVGPLPAELQQGLTFAAAPMKGAANAEAARELVAFLRSPERAALIRSKGLQPQ